MTLEEIATKLEEAHKEFDELYKHGEVCFANEERMKFLDSLIDELCKMKWQLEDEEEV